MTIRKRMMNAALFAAALLLAGCTTPPSGTGGAGNAPAQAGPDLLSSADELDNAIRDASDYLNGNIPGGSKIVILNIQSASQNLSGYIIDELTANAVNDKVFTVVDRQQLETLRAEQQFQFSGEVDDSDALAIGKFFGAQTIVSGAVNRLGTGFRIGIRALEVETAQVQGQFNRNIASSDILTSLMASGAPAAPSASGTGTPPATGGVSARDLAMMAAGMAPSGAAGTAESVTPAAVPAAPAVAEPPITGTMVPGASLAAKLAWLQRTADSHGTYIVEVTADESIAPHRFFFEGAINITIVLKGDAERRTVRLASNGYMFEVGREVTLVLDSNITLMGHPRNSDSMVSLTGGHLKMRTGSVITGNTTTANGGGVNVANGSTFEMTGGSINGNTAPSGGGVYISSGNPSTIRGGGISGNTALTGNGGGICVYDSGVLTIRGGTITGNTAREYGGGVSVSTWWTSFTKNGGTITGYNSDQVNGNAVKDADGNILARRGHAAFFNTNRRKETTAGPEVTLVHDNDGGWDR